MKQITIDYKGIDWWNRPIFKVTGKNIQGDLFVGSVHTLFDNDDSRQTVIDYFKANKSELCIMGTVFGCEPLGTSIKASLKIVFKK